MEGWTWDKFKFWEDTWTGEDNKLLEKYPRLYSISVQQNYFIQQMGEFKDSGWEWDFKWRRPLFDNEIDMAVSFLQELEGNRIRSHRADQWVWVYVIDNLYLSFLFFWGVFVLRGA